MTAASLIENYARFIDDPYGFVLYNYPWGVAGTRLEDEKGPDYWQAEILETLGQELRKRRAEPEKQFAAIQAAIASGHGVGKTSLVSWVISWFIATRPHPQILVTAGTKAQLDTKTWRELAKWNNMSLCGSLFSWTATKFYLKECPDTWYASAIPWSEHNADAFAGTHEKYVLVIFDEASAIADIIWETVEGAMTTSQCIWLAFGNPIRNTGRFKACFGKYRNYWITRKVDSRTAKMANKAQIAQWKEQYGEDSDFFRKRVRGDFPLQSSNQLISEETADMCRKYVAYGYDTFPIRIGVDIAGDGEEADETILTVIQGNKVHECFRIYGDTTKVYSEIVKSYNYWKQKHDRIMIFVDAIGIGKGVYDLLRAAHLPVNGVISGATANDPTRFVNIRIEMWYNMAQAMKEGIDLTVLSPDVWHRLKEDLINIEYYEHPQNQKYQLESVKDLKERELPSPDYGSSLAFSFAYPVPHAVQSGQDKFKKANASSVTGQKRRRISSRGVL